MDSQVGAGGFAFRLHYGFVSRGHEQHVPTPTQLNAENVNPSFGILTNTQHDPNVLLFSYLGRRMESTKLSSKGQVIIPKHIRLAYHWETGQELSVIDTGDGILLKPKAPFSESKISDVAGCLHYAGAAKTVDEMNDAVAKGLKAQFDDCD